MKTLNNEQLKKYEILAAFILIASFILSRIGG